MYTLLRLLMWQAVAGCDMSAGRGWSTCRRASVVRRRELAQLSHVSTMGELAASLAHELKQPHSAIMTDGNAPKRLR